MAWALFVIAWYVVFVKRTNEQTTRGVLALAIFLVVMVLVTVGWVQHNLRIYRRKGPRLQIPVVREDFSHDALGRTVEADWPSMRTAGHVIVDADDQRKRYRAEPLSRPHGRGE